MIESDELQGESYQGHTIRGDAGMSFEEYCAWIAARDARPVDQHIAAHSAPVSDQTAETVRVGK